MESPMTKSQSVSDFWGNRWNLMVHHLLKVCAITRLSLWLACHCQSFRLVLPFLSLLFIPTHTHKCPNVHSPLFFFFAHFDSFRTRLCPLERSVHSDSQKQLPTMGCGWDGLCHFWTVARICIGHCRSQGYPLSRIRWRLLTTLGEPFHLFLVERSTHPSRVLVPGPSIDPMVLQELAQANHYPPCRHDCRSNGTCVYG